MLSLKDFGISDTCLELKVRISNSDSSLLQSNVWVVTPSKKDKDVVRDIINGKRLRECVSFLFLLSDDVIEDMSLNVGAMNHIFPIYILATLRTVVKKLFKVCKAWLNFSKSLSVNTSLKK